MIGKKRKLGKKIQQIEIGERVQHDHAIKDQDILLYSGLTNDANPLCIQHDYASQTSFKRPIVPTAMLTGIVTSLVSRELPGPGCYIQDIHLSFPTPTYHYRNVSLQLTAQSMNVDQNELVVQVHASNEEGEDLITGTLTVQPPKEVDALNGTSLDNFY
ncbi:enoyl-CoA hydratase [Pontibacillus halophilus JSM 076056 = DSM 19796]|uniref:Enoyl-CoA hydratase n=1 Tax=Pontibacillus halophilus JSM 076056 = DSM 19796 TaxID=1385510 RepID=A0A0A5GQD7_9BACI|nr:MaoC/PaaZ C-terminal domain-containing protein [Pontibacillus halophilus]KGX93385.1 enoyl-CoA hydratase [Pontibacillus halophilus JSM 076056 = DSM 19796]